ncbi:MAG TPA: cytochrome c [Devosiaceae bacterium]
MRLASLCLTAAAFVLSVLAVPASAIELPDGPNRDLVYGKCRTCHDLQYLKESEGISARAWNDILDSMKARGLRIDDATRAKIYEYLSTYLGPNPPPPPAAPATATAPAADGKALFADNCSACHQPEGQGVAGQFPPLAGNPDIFANKDFPVYVVLHGLQGPVSVLNASYDGQMPPFDYLEDGEIAAIINFVRASWGNDANRPGDLTDLTAADVHRIRQNPMTADDVHQLRAGLVK